MALACFGSSCFGLPSVARVFLVDRFRFHLVVVVVVVAVGFWGFGCCCFFVCFFWDVFGALAVVIAVVPIERKRMERPGRPL